MNFALSGWKEAYCAELSFRTQTLVTAITLVATTVISPSPFWWALILLVISLVLAAELINTALERTLDGLHPQRAEFVRKAKDCAAGAVLIISCAAVGIFFLMLYDTMNLQR
ncbi:diacylglycerol kinase [Propionivibrio sp.]|uniref:diacylglycerol kinase n=1 Tax=Propionivibrio sp. TaxID=2212460 RepID=UPI003BEFAC8C